jgi:uncharacterized protein
MAIHDRIRLIGLPSEGPAAQLTAGPSTFQGRLDVMSAITIVDVVAALDLEPHPEGGYYRETYRSDERLETERGPRPAATAILFLVSAEHPSRFHRLTSDELWLFHGGARLELTMLLPDARVEPVLLGGAGLVVESELITPQAIVPAGAWQGARVLPGEGVDWSLLTCMVTPGFDFADFELADREQLLVAWPDRAELIDALT